MAPVKISYYSDVLCVWAYVGQRRLEQLVRDFGDQIEIEAKFCSVFPDARSKIETTWKSRDTYTGFNRHLAKVAQKFPHVSMHPELWLKTRPRSSASGHLFVKAVEMVERDLYGADVNAQPYLERLSSRAAWVLRCAFFGAARDISDWNVHREIAEELGVDYDLVEKKIQSSQAVAALASDYDLARNIGVIGSPTYLMNEGRQKLFGNVGYRLLEANVHELLHEGLAQEASWC